LRVVDVASELRELYRLIDEAEFVDPQSYRAHYETIAQRIYERLKAGAVSGEFKSDPHEAHAWALMGMNVFLGLRYAIWGEDGTWSADEVARAANAMLANGIVR